MRLTEQEYQELMRRKAAVIALSQTIAPVAIPGPTVPLRASVMAVGRTARGVMNRTEARFASEVLDVQKATGEIKAYWYESIKLRLASGAWFTVDFFVMLPDGRLKAVEVKGHWRQSARQAIKVAAELYPFTFTAVRPVRKRDGGGWKYEEFG